jgi:hypothetical protein
MVSSGMDAEMSCTVSGNPLERDDVHWTNQDVKDFAHRHVTSFEDNTLTLKFSKATVEDMGRFYCIANNRIGVEKNASTLLIVEREWLFSPLKVPFNLTIYVTLLLSDAPVAHSQADVVKVASGNDMRAKFVCEGSGAPQVDFFWYKNITGSPHLNRTVKYLIEIEKVIS